MSEHSDYEIDNILNEFLSDIGNGNKRSIEEAEVQPEEPVRKTEETRQFQYTAEEETDSHPSEPPEGKHRSVSQRGKREKREKKQPWKDETIHPILRERREEPRLPRILRGIVGTICALLSLAVLLWVGINVHPATERKVSSVIDTKADLTGRLDSFSNNSKADALSGLSYIKKVYKIDENATAAPVPNPYGFYKIPISDASKVDTVIQQARDSGLLGEEEEVVFNSKADFYYDSEIGYYLDDTILVICWKEVIDGNTCTFSEVKVADASQFRRKFVNDTFSADAQDYASNIARSVNAVVAMNADFYGFRTFGIVVYQRNLFRFNEEDYMDGLKNYNCVDTAFIDGSGNFKFFHRGETSTPEAMQKYIDDNDILFSIAFGPILVENGELQSCDSYPAGEVNTGYSRAGIGQVSDLHYLYMSLNHSTEKAARWTVNEFAQHFYDKGVVNAYCLDGGQTSEIVFDGEPFNYIDFGAERTVTDIIYFGTALTDWEALS